ncbi:glycerol uptake facilitator protein [Geomicrobium sp. JCM 19037]|uniref:MIP/aquaporin family protein n=1 Tax=unclassified Geomicrobium TaxID=2628951 RepID=UPI00045F4C89|nr:MIP/aquaporin family protein [Geomicrobium sp. JCM 19037]GAK03685.1 glycerol uptake facilitator protein [Geomicrobium sp. JCM 19037]
MLEIIAEFIGTMILIIFGAGVVAAVNLRGSKAEGAGWIAIALGWGFAVTLGVYVSGTVSDGHINPAVTLAFAAIGDFPWSQVPGYIIGQVAGAFVGAVIVFFHYYPHWKATPDPGTKLGVFATGPAIRHLPSNVGSEFIGTAVLVFGLLAIGANTFTEGLNPIAVGVLIAAIGLSLGGTTGYAINPARDLGPRLAHAILPIDKKGPSDWAYAWVPILGPIAGGIVGAFLFVLIF